MLAAFLVDGVQGALDELLVAVGDYVGVYLQLGYAVDVAEALGCALDYQG